MSLWRVAGIAVLAGACVTSCAGRIDPEWERFLAEDEARWQQARADARAVGVETPPDIPEQPLISGMLLWGADIAVITEDFVSDTRRWKHALWILDQDRGILRPFTEVPCASYHDVAHTARLGRLLVCEKGETTQLLRQVDGRWNEVALAPAGQRVRVVADDQHIVLASEQMLVVLSVASFATVASVATPKVGSGVSPSAMLLAEDRLLVGFSAGEFGGGLYRYTLATDVPTLDPVLLLPENVSALMRSDAGAIWATTGLAHMGGVHGGLHRLDGPQPEAITFNNGFEFEPGQVRYQGRSGIELPGLSRLIGLAPGPNAEPMFILPEFGVFELSAGTLVGRYTGVLRFSYLIHDGLAIASSGPVGLVTTPDSEVYVASRSLGVLKLPPTGRQVVQHLFAPRGR